MHTKSYIIHSRLSNQRRYIIRAVATFFLVKIFRTLGALSTRLICQMSKCLKRIYIHTHIAIGEATNCVLEPQVYVQFCILKAIKKNISSYLSINLAQVNPQALSLELLPTSLTTPCLFSDCFSF